MPPAAVLSQHSAAGNRNEKKSHKYTRLDCVFPVEQHEVKMIGIMMPLAPRQNVNNVENSLMLSSPKGEKKGSLILGN